MSQRLLPAHSSRGKAGRRGHALFEHDTLLCEFGVFQLRRDLQNESISIMRRVKRRAKDG